MEVHIHRHILLLLFLVIFSCSLFSSQAFKFYVGGKDGWVLNPSENYTHWTERNRFQVNDTLVFKYKKGSDSVLVVNKDDYYNCNTKNPIKKLEEGDSEYKVEKSGPFFFISGKKQNCEKGQKLLVVVLSVKHNNTIKHNPPISSPTQSPTHPPSKTPVSAPTPASSSPSISQPPSISLAPAPILAPGPVSLAPASYSPGPAPESSISSPASSPSPGSSSISSPPASSPGSEPEASPSPSLSPSNSPTSSPPAPPSESPVNSPSNSPSSSQPSSQSPSPGSGTPGSQTAPTPAPSSAWAVTPSYVLLGSVTLLLSGAF